MKIKTQVKSGDQWNARNNPSLFGSTLGTK